MPRKQGRKQSRKQKETPEAEREDAPPARRGPRPFWSGTIAFGLVNVPVSLYVANRTSRVALRMVDPDGVPLNRRYFCSKEEKVLEADEIVRGYEIEKDRFVLVDDEELEALAPEKSQEIDLKRFVPRDQIDPVYFERSYFLAPEGGSNKAYRLLAATMERVGRAGVATFVMRGKEYLVAIIAEAGLLRAETLRFVDEIRSPATVGLPAPEAVAADEVRRLTKAMAELETDVFRRDALRDHYSRRVRELAERKLAAGEDVVAPPEEAEPEPEGGAEVIDLMKVLQRSVSQEDDGKSSGGEGRRRTDGDAGRRTPRARARGDGKTERAGPAPAELARRSKNELYEQAKALDIPGRSDMNKSELIEAICAAG